jgi:hypothetical protein
MSYDILSNNAPAFTLEGTQSRCASSNELSIRSVTMSDIDAEDVVETVATSEANAAPTRAVAVSLSAKDTRLRSLKRLPFSSISGNSVTSNGIVTRGNEGFWRLAANSFFHKRDATGHLGHSAEQKVAAALRVLVTAEAFDPPDHFLRMSEESIRQSILRPTQNITEMYAQTVKLPTNEGAMVIASDLPIMSTHSLENTLDHF